MSKARIYRPDKTAMQSGKANDDWVLEFAPATPIFVENLMGWEGMTDMPQQVRLKFATSEEAVAYAKRQGLVFELFEPHTRHHVSKAYADNFLYNKPKF